MKRDAKFKDELGKRFGILTVVSAAIVKRATAASAYWNCVCDCGKVRVVRGLHLRNGDAWCCGCTNRSLRHGHYVGGGPSLTWKAWRSMWARCTNRKLRSYPNYGGRGITVCKRWKMFECFLADMGNKPPGLSLDRINNNGNYEPGNCRWATWEQQAENRRNSKTIEFRGETHCANGWSRRLEIPAHRILAAMKRGKPLESLLITNP